MTTLPTLCITENLDCTSPSHHLRVCVPLEHSRVSPSGITIFNENRTKSPCSERNFFRLMLVTTCKIGSSVTPVPRQSVNCLNVVFLKVRVKFEQRFQSSAQVLFSKPHLPCERKSLKIKQKSYHESEDS